MLKSCDARCVVRRGFRCVGLHRGVKAMLGRSQLQTARVGTRFSSPIPDVPLVLTVLPVCFAIPAGAEDTVAVSMEAAKRNALEHVSGYLESITVLDGLWRSRPPRRRRTWRERWSQRRTREV